jgi:hypothetical protein
MSTTTNPGEIPALDLREQVVRIDRAIAETQKLLAESRKFNRDPWFLIGAAVVAGLAAIVARLPEIIHAIRAPV